MVGDHRGSVFPACISRISLNFRGVDDYSKVSAAGVAVAEKEKENLIVSVISSGQAVFFVSAVSTRFNDFNRVIKDFDLLALSIFEGTIDATSYVTSSGVVAVSSCSDSHFRDSTGETGVEMLFFV